MKLPGLLSNVLPKKPEPKSEVYLTCTLYDGSIEACVWDVDDKKKTDIIAISTQDLAEYTWQGRAKALKGALGELSGETEDKAINQVVLGLTPTFLTKNGDIDPQARKELGLLMRELHLKPLGFVPVHQALIFSLKQEEGIPPNVILLSIDKKTTHLYLYKVGQLTGEKILDTSVSIVDGVEKGLGSFTDIEVLPSRLLLYGSDQKILEAYQTELLKHPWQTKANFLHFPKIEIYPLDLVLQSISLAGASELNLIVPEEGKGDGKSSADSPEERWTGEKGKSAGTQTADEPIDIAEEPNIEVVPPSELGFGPEDGGGDDEEPDDDEAPIRGPAGKKRGKPVFRLPKLSGSVFSVFGKFRLPGRLQLPKSGFLIPVVLVLLAAFLYMLYWFLPHATITIRLVPQPIDVAQAITIDPGAVEVDAGGNVIPGKEISKSISGEKKVAVTGKKKVGDPARGTVTIYNKSTSLRTLKKGTVLLAGSLQFTLDNDIQVASASENLASSLLTYGKGTTTITASAIGTDSNLPANTEFSIKDVSSSIAVARNDQPLSGGTSRDALVVSRADQDALVKVLTAELTERARTELSTNLSLGETLIPQTVKTAVAEKTFSQELNAEASELSGNVTVSATGITYVTGDVLTLLKNLVTARVPVGYKLLEANTKSDVGNVKIAKNGKIMTDATIHSVAVPEVDSAKIQSQATGKTVEELGNFLKSIPGVGDMSIVFRFSPMRSRFPINPRNISVVISTAQ